MSSVLQSFARRAGTLSIVALASLGLVLAAGPARGKSVVRGVKPVIEGQTFHRIATFPVFLNTDIETESVSEIVAATADGMMLVYTDSENEALGFVDIADPANPQPAGLLELDGEPTSVAVAGAYALAGVNTSESFVDPSGTLEVIDIASQTVIRSIDVGGQPDSVAVSPDGAFAAVVIENERDEEICAGGEYDGMPVPEDDDEAAEMCENGGGVVGGLPQLPAGYLVVVNLTGAVSEWQATAVDLTGLAEIGPTDPEPEYVDINSENIAAVSLQENNHIVLVDLASTRVVNDFPAGTVDLEQVDVEEDDVIRLGGSLQRIPREPDGLTWIGDGLIATADEGDLFGGSRGFTLYDHAGHLVYEPGNEVEHAAVRVGHYPEGRSENKGNEPENVEYGRYGNRELLFVGSERASTVYVYELRFGQVLLVQVLPTGVAPEGLLAVPQRGLFVAASEDDARDDKFRSGLSIFQLRRGVPNYPRVMSANRPDGTPIPWGALSGLAIDPRGMGQHAYTIHDSFYEKSRIFSLDLQSTPALINAEIVLHDGLGLLAAVDDGLVNGDGTVNLDPEGIALARDGGFWVVSEGAGSANDEDRPIESNNLLLHVAHDGTITRVVTLPDGLNERQLRFGFEGVASVPGEEGELVYVAFQREWRQAAPEDPKGHVRIGRFDTATGEWSFVYYPIDDRESPNGGWVGLSDLTYLGDDTFVVLERDNQGGADARIKRLYTFTIAGVSFQDDAATPGLDVLTKTLARDLIADGDLDATGGQIREKFEGLGVLRDGTTVVVNDNDGVDDSNGETQLIRIPHLFGRGR